MLLMGCGEQQTNLNAVNYSEDKAVVSLPGCLCYAVFSTQLIQEVALALSVDPLLKACKTIAAYFVQIRTQ